MASKDSPLHMFIFAAHLFCCNFVRLLLLLVVTLFLILSPVKLLMLMAAIQIYF